MSELFWEFLSNLALLGSGGLVSYFLIHRYQKTKDVRETRESVLQLSLEVHRKFLRLLQCWNKWVDWITQEDSSNTETNQETNNAEEIELDESNLLYRIENAFIEVRFALTLLLGRLDVHFKLPSNAREAILKLEEKIKNYGEMMETIQETGESPKDFRKEGMILSKYFNALIPIILRAQPK